MVIDGDPRILGGFHSVQQATGFCSQAVVITFLKAAREAGAPARIEIITEVEHQLSLDDLYGIAPQTGAPRQPPRPIQHVEARL
jgi:hypothetical protein